MQQAGARHDDRRGGNHRRSEAPRHRTTFLTIRDVLEEIRERFMESRTRVVGEMRENGVTRRQELFLQHLERLALDFDASLARILEEGSSAVLETRTQYSSDQRMLRDAAAATTSTAASNESGQAPVGSIEDACAALLELDARTNAMCALIASSESLEQVRTHLAAVAGLVRAQSQAVLRASQTVEDL